MGYQSTLTSWADDTWPEYAPDEVLPGLFQGGTEDDQVIGYPAADHHYGRIRGGSAAAPYPFDVVVTLYADAQPAPWGVREHRYGFADGSLGQRDAAVVMDLARMAHEAWKGGAQVLVRCQAGVNRSGLVAALVLMLEGYSAVNAIALLRARRGSVVLCNEEFEEWLLTSATAAITSSCGFAA
jgi:hypothetical protein